MASKENIQFDDRSKQVVFFAMIAEFSKRNRKGIEMLAKVCENCGNTCLDKNAVKGFYFLLNKVIFPMKNVSS